MNFGRLKEENWALGRGVRLSAASLLEHDTKERRWWESGRALESPRSTKIKPRFPHKATLQCLSQQSKGSERSSSQLTQMDSNERAKPPMATASSRSVGQSPKVKTRAKGTGNDEVGSLANLACTTLSSKKTKTSKLWPPWSALASAPMPPPGLLKLWHYF